MKKLLALIVLCFSLTGTALADTPSKLKFMAGPPGGNWFALGGTLADLWAKEVMPTISFTGAGVDNIIYANAKKGDLGFTQTSMLTAAQKGSDLETFKEIASNAKLMGNLYTQYTYFIARKDFAEKYSIKSVDDLVRKKSPVRFATLKRGTSSEFCIKNIFSAGFGIDYSKTFRDWGGIIEYASYADGVKLIADNYIDVFAFSVGKEADTVKKIESSADVVMLPLSDKVLAEVATAIGTKTFTVDPGIYDCLPKGSEPVKVVGDYTCLVVRGDLDDDLVYKLCKALYENLDALASVVKDIAELDPATATPEGVTETHPGAVKYWAEVAKK